MNDPSLVLMMVSRTAQQRFTASIAILAVLLLFMMPVVSTSLTEPLQVRGAKKSTDVPAATFVHHHEASTQAFPEQRRPSGSLNHGLMSDYHPVCGYCDLLIHVPLILWLFTPLIWMITRIAQVLPQFTLSVPVIRHPYGFPHSRAPPWS